MLRIINLVVIILLISCTRAASNVRGCIESAFNATCKSHLYKCLDTPGCSFQLTMNTQHIILTNDTLPKQIPTAFFSHPDAIELYSCLQEDCSKIGFTLPNIDTNFTKKLSLSSCIYEMYERCGGKDMEAIYK